MIELEVISYSKEGHIRTLLADLHVETKRFDNIHYGQGHIVIEGNRIIVLKGFKWNGCTVVKDCKRTDVACCVHDALYSQNNIPISRKIKDQILYDLAKQKKFWGAWIYYAGVRTFGKVGFKVMRALGIKVNN
jgi:hypothetical protein